MIKAENISKTFKLYQKPTDRLKEILLNRVYHRKHGALKNINFTTNEGETLGIIGENGAGKSTLLKIITGILMPDSGRVDIDGRVTGLLELGTGFNPEFSGLQNIYLNGTYRGMPKREISTKLEDIVAFSELAEYIDNPLKTYSSGMIMRLAFSVAMHANPNVFVIDEALSVGDAYFQQKCIKKIMEFKQKGGSILFVSHSMNAVKILCDKVILLDDGVVVEEGDPEAVINTYNFLLAKRTKGEQIRIVNPQDKAKKYGNLKLEVRNVKITNKNHIEAKTYISGEPLNIEITLAGNEDLPEVSVGILVRDKFGQDIFGTNTYHMGKPIKIEKDKEIRIKYAIEEFNIGPGKYTLTVAAHKGSTHVTDCYHWLDAIKSFEVIAGNDFSFIGLSRLKPAIQVVQR